MLGLLGVLLLSALPKISNAITAFALTSLIGDHMVLQQGTAAVWGQDKPKQKVTVSINGMSASSRTDARGRWKVLLDHLQAGGPFEMTIHGSQTVVVHDVLVGEVWLGSGQSNMEFTMKESNDASKMIPAAKDDQLRLFLQARAMGLSPKSEPSGQWVVCSPENVVKFSAVAYHFGRELRLGLKVPVGVISASWGGSYIESWMPEKALATLPETKGLLKAWKSTTPAQRAVWAKGVKPELEMSEVRFVPKDPKQKPLTVLLSKNGMDGPGVVGGEWVGEAKEGSQAVYENPDILGPKNATVGKFSGQFEGGAWGSVYTKLRSDDKAMDLSSFKSVEFSAKGSGEFFIYLPQPSIQDSCFWSSHSFKVTKTWKTYRIDFDKLKQDHWGKPTPFTQNAIKRFAFGVVLPSLSNIPDVLYNGMIAPATPYRIRGVIWYQGEANEWAAKSYRRLLSTMITAWRKAWDEGDFPFLICQLPEFKSHEKEPSDGNWATIREGQTIATQLPNVEMAVLLGLGEANDIHPKNKTDVGKRLGRVALHTVYGEAVEWTGPRYESMTVEGSKIRVKFRYAEKGLKTSSGRVRGFAEASADGKFQWATAKIEGSSVLVWNDQVTKPVAVRYAWADNPDANLTGKNGLPAAPFRSDEPLK
jgi:sialate O-acetylesterase